MSAEVKELIKQNRELMDIRRLLDEGKLTSVDLVSYYAANCLSVGRQLNLQTTEYFDDGLVLAKALDEERETLKN